MVPERTWGWYATRTYENMQRSGRQVHNRRRFEESVAVDGMRRLTQQAEQWLTMFDLDPRRLAEALVDGHPPRYARRRE